MVLIKIFSIDEDIIQIYNNKDIKFFYYNFVNITLKVY